MRPPTTTSLAATLLLLLTATCCVPPPAGARAALVAGVEEDPRLDPGTPTAANKVGGRGLRAVRRPSDLEPLELQTRSISRGRRSGRRRIPTPGPNATTTSSMSSTTSTTTPLPLPEGFRPPPAPVNPLLYPFATAQLPPGPAPALDTDGWRPITHAAASREPPTRPIGPAPAAAPRLPVTVTEATAAALHPAILEALRETIIYGLPKPRQPDASGQPGPDPDDDDLSVDDVYEARPTDAVDQYANPAAAAAAASIDRGDSPGGDVILDSLVQKMGHYYGIAKRRRVPGRGGPRQSVRPAPTRVEERRGPDNPGGPPAAEDGAEKPSQEEHELSQEEALSTEASHSQAAAPLPDEGKTQSKETTWPPASSSSSSSEEAPASDESAPLRSQHFVGDDLEVPRPPGSPSSVAQLGVAYANQTGDAEPTICVPMHVSERSPSAPGAVVRVERVYCFPLPPEMLLGIRAPAEELAKVAVLRDDVVLEASPAAGRRPAPGCWGLVVSALVWAASRRQ